MGRRALRRIDPALDLSKHLRTLAELPQPLQAASLFGATGPLELEVGSGKGLFLVTAAAAHPERLFLGSEVARKYARFAASRLARAGLDNAQIVQGDAQRLFAELLPDACAAAVHVYFPDPWWKHRHLRRRIMNERFVRDIQRVLQADGRLHFWTDVPEYFQAALETIARATTLAGPLAPEECSSAYGPEARTHFERRMRQHEVDVHRAEFRRP